MKRRYAALGAGVLSATAVLFGLHVLRSNSNARPSGRQADADRACPRVVLKETDRNLGTLDPSDKCRHTFIVRNEGDAPLKIVKAGASCKCTVSVLPARDIPPGMGGPIEIESKTDGVAGTFSHVAAFRTNDPKTPRFELTIRGDIRSYIAADPPSIYVTELKAGEPVKMSAMIVSEVWDAFALKKVSSTVEGLSWEFQPAPPEKLQEYNARSGYVASFRLPGNWSGREFSGWVEADASPTGKAERNRQDKTRKIRVRLGGRKAALRTVYGPQVDQRGVVHIGTLNRGKGARTQLLLKIRGDHREINVLDIKTSPAFLKVKVYAESPELAKKGLYKIVVEVPPDAPPGSHILPDEMGTLQVLTDHPEMPEIVKLKVSFAVLSEWGT